jgi:hypothetical protein
MLATEGVAAEKSARRPAAQWPRPSRQLRAFPPEGTLDNYGTDNKEAGVTAGISTANS